MSAGWELKEGTLSRNNVAVDEYWAYFNYVFSEACRKTTSYKFGMVKAILDSLFSAELTDRGMELPYRILFSKFTENYWNLIAKYEIKQLRSNGKNIISKLEQIIYAVRNRNKAIGLIDFENLNIEDKSFLITQVHHECKKNVIGALYKDFKGDLYGFSQKEDRIWIHIGAYQFMTAYKLEIEKMNYYAWAKFLDQINDDPPVSKIIEKLELSTPQRKNLSIYREILRQEFEINNCFYCGGKISEKAQVDHVLPWSFMKSDHLWNFVLTCPKCNSQKRDMLPNREKLVGVISRNQRLKNINMPFIQEEFTGYTDDIMWDIWSYAVKQGYQIYKTN